VLYPDETGDTQGRQGLVEQLPPESLLRTTPQGLLYSLPSGQQDATCVVTGEGWGSPREFGPGQPLYRWAGQAPTLGLVRRAAGLARLHFTAHSFAVPRQLEVAQGGQV